METRRGRNRRVRKGAPERDRDSGVRGVEPGGTGTAGEGRRSPEEQDSDVRGDPGWTGTAGRGKGTPRGPGQWGAGWGPPEGPEQCDERRDPERDQNSRERG